MRLNLSAHVVSALSAAKMDNIEQMQNFMTDLALGREMFNAEGDKISKAEANELVHDFSLKVLCINNVKDRKEVRQGLRDHGREWLDIIETTTETAVTYGISENEWFNDFVDKMTIGYGDRADFYSEEESILSIVKTGESHHDHVLQRIAAGQVVPVPAFRHVVKIGADINRYVLGDVDWSKWVLNIARSFVAMIQEETYAELIQAVTSLPGRFKGTGTLDATTKASFDDIVQAVSAANNGANVVIMGAKAALSKISGLADVNWAAKDQRDNVMNTGNIGIYEGTTLLEIPNRFKDKTYSQYVFDTDKLYIIPVIGDEGKFIKMVDEGDTEIFEVFERNEKYVSDLQTYEVQRRLGFGLYIGRMFGYWDI